MPGDPSAEDGDDRRAPPRFTLSTRTATQAAHGTLVDRLLDLRPPDAGTAAAPRPTRPHLQGDAAAAAPVAPRGGVPRSAARDAVCLAAQAYVRALRRDGSPPAAAVAAAHATVHQGAAFLSARRLAALERAVLRAAHAACR